MSIGEIFILVVSILTVSATEFVDDSIVRLVVAQFSGLLSCKKNAIFRGSDL